MNKGRHEDHPGFTQSSCPLRITINAHPQGTSHNGFACSHTGGHCVKSEHCDSRVESFNNQETISAHILEEIEQEDREHWRSRHDFL